MVLGLKLSSTPRPLTSDTRTKTPQDVVLGGIAHQIAAIKDENYTVEKIRYSGSGTEATKRVKAIRPRPWWWFDQSQGIYLLQLRYGASHLVELEPGKFTIHCSKDQQSVLKALETLVNGIQAGKLDGPIAAAAEKAKRKHTV
jgi:hypothetical protein